MKQYKIYPGLIQGHIRFIKKIGGTYWLAHCTKCNKPPYKVNAYKVVARNTTQCLDCYNNERAEQAEARMRSGIEQGSLVALCKLDENDRDPVVASHTEWLFLCKKCGKIYPKEAQSFLDKKTEKCIDCQRREQMKNLRAPLILELARINRTLSSKPSRNKRKKPRLKNICPYPKGGYNIQIRHKHEIHSTYSKTLGGAVAIVDDIKNNKFRLREKQAALLHSIKSDTSRN